MEKNLVIIVSFIFVVILILVVVHYGFKFIFKSSDMKPSKIDSTLQQPEKKLDSDKEYRMLIEKTKDDYKNFMDKARMQ